jgi:hypothetical protein
MTAPPATSGTSNQRIQRYGVTSTALALLSNRQLGRVLPPMRSTAARRMSSAKPLLGNGIGGTSALLDIDGTPVFAKRIPLTDLERRAENVMSTANLFDLPTYCHYGVGSAGGGVWRELAAHTMTTNWVLSGQSERFPLMYHWRVLTEPSATPPTRAEPGSVDELVEYWHGSEALRHRLEALSRATASVVLFLEYVPQNLDHWLRDQLARGDDALQAACAMVEAGLRDDVSYMNANGLFHFDAHFGNILTDGRRLYLTDFGLATSTRFELSATEREFVDANRSHDGCYALMRLVNWLVSALVKPADPAERNAYIRRVVAGSAASEVPPWAAEIIARYAPIAVVLNDFYWSLFGESRKTPYPTAEVERVCAEIGFTSIVAPIG